MAIRVVFVPGFMQRGSAWAPVADLLEERYPRLLLDHREHDFEGRLREIADAGQGAVVCGYSLGGRLALHAAVREADERLAAWMESTAIEEVVAVWERQPVFADQSESLVEAQRPGRLTHDPRSLALLLRTAGQGALEPVWHDLRGFDLPLLAIAGARDEGYSAAAKRIARTAPRARVAIVEDAGHAAHLQRPDEVARLITEFLDQI